MNLECDTHMLQQAADSLGPALGVPSHNLHRYIATLYRPCVKFVVTGQSGESLCQVLGSPDKPIAST